MLGSAQLLGGAGSWYAVALVVALLKQGDAEDMSTNSSVAGVWLE